MPDPIRLLPAAALAAMLASGAAWADAGHKGKHYAFGQPGTESEIDRTVEVIADDQPEMTFKMDLGAIKPGETIRFVVTNQGQGPHEFSIGDTASQRAHANLMKKNPHMKHENDPTAVTLEPGETKSLIWTFGKSAQGDIVFACQMPGHYEAGMVHKAKIEKGKKAS